MLFVGAYPPRQVTTRAISEELAVRLRARAWAVATTSHRPERLLRPLDQLATIWRRRQTADVAVVDVYSGAAFRWAEWAVAALRRARVPAVLTLHGGNLPAFAAREPGRLRRLLAAAAAVTAPSSYLADVARPIRPDVQVVPNPVAIEAYVPRRPGPARPRLVWLRAFHALYDPVLAVEVVARLAPEFPDLTLEMTGPDKDGSAAAVRAAAERLGVAAHVHVHGAVAKAAVPARLARGDIFLNTTTVDNAPVSVIEALATGLCVVSTNVGGIPHLVSHGDDALLVPPRDAGAMADAVRRVLTDTALASQLAAAGRASAERFAWAAVLPEWERLLTGVARS